MMTKVILRRPEKGDEAQVMGYLREFEEAGDSRDGTSGLGEAESYPAWLAQVRANSDPATVKPGLVDETLLLAVEPETGGLVGMIDIRHRLNDHLLLHGGHIGYSVRPSQRRKGYATAMLAQALDLCRERGMDRVLVTCDRKNTASARVIQANGGKLENEVQDGDRVTQRYWITLQG